MRTIYKYPIQVQDHVNVQTYLGAKFIHAAMQEESLCIWLEVDTDQPMTFKDFEIYGTGHVVSMRPEDGRHAASVLDRQFVWHIYEVK